MSSEIEISSRNTKNKISIHKLLREKMNIFNDIGKVSYNEKKSPFFRTYLHLIV